MSTVTQEREPQSQRPEEIGTWTALLRPAGLALAVGIVLNLILFLIGQALGLFPPEALTPIGVPVDPPAVIGATAFAVVASGLGFALARRFFAPTTARRLYTIGALVAFGLMFFSPFGIIGAPVGQIVILEMMHVIALGVPWYLLTRSVARSSR